jgi:hypothetical protein
MIAVAASLCRRVFPRYASRSLDAPQQTQQRFCIYELDWFIFRERYRLRRKGRRGDQVRRARPPIVQHAVKLAHCLDRNWFSLPSFALNQNDLSVPAKHEIDSTISAAPERFLTLYP